MARTETSAIIAAAVAHATNQYGEHTLLEVLGKAGEVQEQEARAMIVDLGCRGRKWVAATQQSPAAGPIIPTLSATRVQVKLAFPA